MKKPKNFKLKTTWVRTYQIYKNLGQEIFSKVYMYMRTFLMLTLNTRNTQFRLDKIITVVYLVNSSGPKKMLAYDYVNA